MEEKDVHYAVILVFDLEEALRQMTTWGLQLLRYLSELGDRAVKDPVAGRRADRSAPDGRRQAQRSVSSNQGGRLIQPTARWAIVCLYHSKLDFGVRFKVSKST